MRPVSSTGQGTSSRPARGQDRARPAVAGLLHTDPVARTQHGRREQVEAIGGAPGDHDASTGHVTPRLRRCSRRGRAAAPAARTGRDAAAAAAPRDASRQARRHAGVSRAPTQARPGLRSMSPGRAGPAGTARRDRLWPRHGARRRRLRRRRSPSRGALPASPPRTAARTPRSRPCGSTPRTAASARLDGEPLPGRQPAVAHRGAQLADRAARSAARRRPGRRRGAGRCDKVVSRFTPQVAISARPLCS